MLEPRRTQDSLVDAETGRRPLSRKDFADSLTTPSEPVEPAGLVTRDDSEIVIDDDDEIERLGAIDTPDTSAREISSGRDIKQSRRNENQPELAALNPTNTSDQRPSNGNDSMTLFSEFEVNDLRARWSDVQAAFVDSPRRSVEQADELVATVMQRIADSFAEERSSLERQWDRGDNASTEDLRVALQRYRDFFSRLLNAA